MPSFFLPSVYLQWRVTAAARDVPAPLLLRQVQQLPGHERPLPCPPSAVIGCAGAWSLAASSFILIVFFYGIYRRRRRAIPSSRFLIVCRGVMVLIFSVLLVSVSISIVSVPAVRFGIRSLVCGIYEVWSWCPGPASLSEKRSGLWECLFCVYFKGHGLSCSRDTRLPTSTPWLWISYKRTRGHHQARGMERKVADTIQ